MQMVGRGSRVTPTKSRFTILDFGNNVHTHGFWEDNREWSLKKKRKRESAGIGGVKNCKNCDSIIPVAAMKCKNCGYEYQRKAKPEAEAVSLQMLTKAQGMEIAKQSTAWQKAQLAKAKVISPYWVLHNCKDRVEAEQFVAFMGWKRGWLFHNAKRFKIFQQ
jgi:DNA-directed RNA polymerase subunit M/transcription elongation factor TFIIS